MAWQTPKTDWATNPKNPKSEDFNRIEGNIDFLKTDIETKKALIVNAISDMNQPALVTDTHLELANKIRSISSDANAAVGDVEKGKTFYAGGAKKTGTLELTGDAATGNVLSGKTFYNTDLKTKFTGIMPNRGRAIITPGTVNKPIAQGYHDGTGYVVGDADLKAENIKKGINIFGITGAMPERPWFDNWGGEWQNIYGDVVTIPESSSASFSAPVGDVRKVLKIASTSMEFRFYCGTLDTGELDSLPVDALLLEGNKTSIGIRSAWSGTKHIFINTVRLPGATMWTYEVPKNGNFFAPAGKEYLALGCFGYSISHTDGTNIAEDSISGTGIKAIRTWVTSTFGIRSHGTYASKIALWGIENPGNIVPVYGMLAPDTSIKPPVNKKWVLWHLGAQHKIQQISTGILAGGTSSGSAIPFVLDGNGDYELYAYSGLWASYAGGGVQLIKKEVLRNAFKPRIGNIVQGVVRNGLEYAPEKIPDDHIFVGDGFTDSGLRYVIAVSIEDFEKMFGDAVGDDGAFDFEKMVNIDKEKGYGFGQYIGSLKREVGNASQPR